MPTTVSPWRVRIARNTPCADGCCGPMFITSRSLPPYPISITCRVCVSAIAFSSHRGARLAARPAGPPRPPRGSHRCALAHRRGGRRIHDDGPHLRQQGRGLRDEGLPRGVLERPRAYGGTLVEVAVGPQVHRL